jgi:glycosyltransferase involved in cell wall biosynthesis
VPSFSVVVPAFQAAGTIVGAVESALRQTLAPHEVIVVDDGSTDGTGATLEPYRERIVLVRKENGGGASALNVGLLASTGEFVCPLDADDVYEPGRLHALGALAAARPDLDLLGTDCYLERDGAAVQRFSERTPFATTNQRSAIFGRSFVVQPAIRRTRLLAIGGYDESLRIAYDWDCYLRLLLAGAVAGCVDEPLYRYRLHSASLTGSRAAALRERVTVLEQTANRFDLTRNERRAFESSLREHERRALLAEAEEAIRERQPGARRRAFAAARAAGASPSLRLKALLAAVAPGLAADRLRRTNGPAFLG